MCSSLARLKLKSTLRRFSTVINRRHIDDEGDWFYSTEWWEKGSSNSRTVFQEVSHNGNGVVSVVAHPCSKPDRFYWGRTEKWLEQRYAEMCPGFKHGQEFHVSGYEWRTLHFNDFTRQSTVKIMSACREEDPSSLCIMQQAHCLAVPYVKSMISCGLGTISSCNSDLVKNAIDGKQNLNILCIGHGGGSIPLFRLVKYEAILSRSSAEAEYRGVANVVAEVCWLRNLLLELQCPLQRASLVYCDNISEVYLSCNPVQHQRTKHIELDILFVRDKVALGHIKVLHVPSSYQYADIFTKGLPRQLFLDFRDSLSIEPPPALTTGV